MPEPLMSKKRIFVAIPISEIVTEEVRRWGDAHGFLPVRWLAPKNLHVTLVPPWYEENVDAVKQKLASLQSAREFFLEFSNISYGPNLREPRLIWASGDAEDGLLRLKRAASVALSQPEEKRPYRLHLTLARFRPEEFRSFPAQPLSEQVRWRQKVSKIVLMESHLARSGADYEILHEVALG